MRANTSGTQAPSDPRVYLAAERTVLAWLRTGITVMGFGFVVARFGLFLRLLRAEGGAQIDPGISPYLGAALVGLGIIAVAGGVVQYQRFHRSVSATDRPASSSFGLVLGISWALVAMGLMLGFHLLP